MVLHTPAPWITSSPFYPWATKAMKTLLPKNQYKVSPTNDIKLLPKPPQIAHYYVKLPTVPTFLGSERKIFTWLLADPSRWQLYLRLLDLVSPRAAECPRVPSWAPRVPAMKQNKTMFIQTQVPSYLLINSYLLVVGSWTRVYQLCD